ncbi:hypothetical protein RUND412_009812 [Rhizina undulata]
MAPSRSEAMTTKRDPSPESSKSLRNPFLKSSQLLCMTELTDVSALPIPTIADEWKSYTLTFRFVVLDRLRPTAYSYQDSARKVQIIPQSRISRRYWKMPLEDPSRDYVLRKENHIRKMPFKGKTGWLLVDAEQPILLQLELQASAHTSPSQSLTLPLKNQITLTLLICLRQPESTSN